jgi:UDP-glucose 4-epimerase
VEPDAFARQTVLVVGGAGFVGSNTVRRLLALGVSRVVVVDNLLSAERNNLPHDPRVELIEGSIATDAILTRLGDEFEYVFHLATYHGNQSSIADPLADHENNLLTTLKLYERIHTFRRLAKVVYAASGCTLAPHTLERAEPVVEDGPIPLDLDSPYQISKVVGEFYSVYYHTQRRLPTVRARFQNVYGPGEVLGAGRWRGTPATVWRNVVPTFVYRTLRRLPLIVENGGLATRDFIYVDDIVHGLLLCALNGHPGDVYNLASGVETSILELATLINTMTGNQVPVEVGPRREWDRSGRRVGSTEKAKRVLGFEAEVALEEGLRRTIAWTHQHLAFIEACIQKHSVHMAAT